MRGQLQHEVPGGEQGEGEVLRVEQRAPAVVVGHHLAQPGQHADRVGTGGRRLHLGGRFGADGFRAARLGYRRVLGGAGLRVDLAERLEHLLLGGHRQGDRPAEQHQVLPAEAGPQQVAERHAGHRVGGAAAAVRPGGGPRAVRRAPDQQQQQQPEGQRDAPDHHLDLGGRGPAVRADDQPLEPGAAELHDAAGPLGRLHRGQRRRGRPFRGTRGQPDRPVRADQGEHDDRERDERRPARGEPEREHVAEAVPAGHAEDADRPAEEDQECDDEDQNQPHPAAPTPAWVIHLVASSPAMTERRSGRSRSQPGRLDAHPGRSVTVQ